MKRHPSKHQDSSPLNQENTDDPLWGLLGHASEQKPDAFFARNVLREVRLLKDKTPSRASRLATIFTPRRLVIGAIGATTCICALAAFQMRSTSPPSTGTDLITDTIPAPEPASALSELVIEETLNAAAEDPTIFTHDEVVAMIGL